MGICSPLFQKKTALIKFEQESDLLSWVDWKNIPRKMLLVLGTRIISGHTYIHA